MISPQRPSFRVARSISRAAAAGSCGAIAAKAAKRVGWAFTATESASLDSAASRVASGPSSICAPGDVGAIVAVPVPVVYTRPRTVDEIVTHSVSRALDLFGLDTKAFPRWTGPSGVAKRRSGK